MQLPVQNQDLRDVTCDPSRYLGSTVQRRLWLDVKTVVSSNIWMLYILILTCCTFLNHRWNNQPRSEIKWFPISWFNICVLCESTCHRNDSSDAFRAQTSYYKEIKDECGSDRYSTRTLFLSVHIKTLSLHSKVLGWPGCPRTLHKLLFPSVA